MIVFIIATWNRKERLNRCLLSIKEHINLPYKILVVDNASSDGTPDFVKLKHPDVILIENKENLGFSRANNIGITHLKKRDIKTKLIIFLNDDAYLPDSSLKKLWNILNAHPEIKAAVPAVKHESGEFQTGVGGYELSLASAFNYSFFLSLLFPNLFKGFYIPQKYFFKKKICPEIDWLSGVCLAARSDAFTAVSGFPEDFFMYAEDIALGQELRKSGKLIYCPLALIIHMSKNKKDEVNTLWLDSLFSYYENRASGIKPLILKSIFSSGFILRYFIYSFLAVFNKKNKYFLKAKEVKEYAGYAFKKMWR